MKIKITVDSNYNSKVKLFGAKFAYIMVNFGNEVGINISKIEGDDEYKQKIGDYVNPFSEKSYTYFSAFLLDCIKYNFIITSINGEPLKRLVKSKKIGEYDTYEIIEELNPYSDMYVADVKSGENIFEFEIKLN